MLLPPLEVVVHAAEIVGRVAVRDQPASRADDERQVLDADRALVLARAAGRALPQHLSRCRSRRACGPARRRAAPPASAGSAVFGLSSLPGAPGRAVHLAAAAFDARERVEHDLAAEILDRLEPDLLLLEIQIGHVAELGRLQEDRRSARAPDGSVSTRGSAPGTTRMTSAWSHQLTRPASDASSRRQASRNVTISVVMNRAITIDSSETF